MFNIITTYYKKLVNLISDHKSLNVNKVPFVPKSKIDSNHIHELMIESSKQTILNALKTERSQEYLNLRTKEKQLEPHLPAHLAIIQQMQAITKDLEILREELFLQQTNTALILDKIKADLKFISYKK